MITKLSAYVSIGKRSVTITDYDPTRLSYKIRVVTEYKINNLLPDAIYKDSLRLRITSDDFKGDPPAEIGRVTSIKVGSTDHVRSAHILTGQPFSTEVPLEIPEAGSEVILFEYEAWAVCSEIQTMNPQRAVAHISMDILSRCDNTPRVQIEGDPRGPVSLLFNQPVPFQPVQGIAPGERIFVYRLLPPEQPAHIMIHDP